MAKCDSTRPAYPQTLCDGERALLGIRRSVADPTNTSNEPAVGVALSGGGIRSATFALGLFQALAKFRLIGKIDYLSTVSGGGYFGSFLIRLFSRDYVKSPRDVESVLHREMAAEHSTAASTPTLDCARRKILHWLRENGRYLSPRGAGDLLTAAASLTRSWLTLQVVLGMLALALFLAMQAPRVYAVEHHDPWLHAIRIGLTRLPLASQWLWWSPWIIANAVLVVLALPVGAAYWIVSRRGERGRTWLSLGVVIIVVPAVFLMGPHPRQTLAALAHLQRPAVGGSSYWPVAAILFVLGVLTGVSDAVALWFARRAAPDPNDRLFIEATRRRTLSDALKRLLIAVGVTAALTLVDSFGQTLYALLVNHQIGTWAAGLGAVLATGSAFFRQIAMLFGSKADTKRPTLSMSVMASIFAMILVTVLLTGFSTLSHAIVWQFGPTEWHGDVRPTSANMTITAPIAGGPLIASAVATGLPVQSRVPRRADWAIYFEWLLGSTLLAAAFGWTFSFVNESSQQPLYRSRLTRAYLGASNPARWDDAAKPVTDPLPGDDVDVVDYFKAATDHGAPLHLINVTVNETVGGRSQVEQRDRKGLGLAVGPCGLSLGVRHHAVIVPGRGAAPGLRFFPVPEADPCNSGAAFRVFEREREPDGRPHAPASAKGESPLDLPGTQTVGERLSLGQWVGISGAAFSTGMGARTSLGLSLLTGLANVRLGYWWDSRIDPAWRDVKSSVDVVWRFFERCFKSQTYLLYELIARFPGTSRARWYLSDGGHFENMGAYELIRRRVPLIIVVDAEEDAAYTFEGLANLVRKARLDFDTEITFLSDEELGRVEAPKRAEAERAEDETPARAYARLFGSLDTLRRIMPKHAPASALPVSGGHCALARVTYLDGAAPTWLLYVKPTLTGDEPADLIEYARNHDAFPHEPTTDQFFDEAQWESYRKLGEHIAEKIFTAPEPIADFSLAKAAFGPPPSR